jgi:hypothetical protein
LIGLGHRRHQEFRKFLPGLPGFQLFRFRSKQDLEVDLTGGFSVCDAGHRATDMRSKAGALPVDVPNWY